MKDFVMAISTISLIGLIITLTIISINKRKNPPKSIPKVDKLSLIFGVIFIFSLIGVYFIPSSTNNSTKNEPIKNESLSKETMDKMQKEIKASIEVADNNKIKSTLSNEIEHISLMTAAINENKSKKTDLKIIIDKCAMLSKEGQYRLSEMQKYIKDSPLKNAAKNIENSYSYYKEAMVYAFKNADTPDKQNSDKYKENLEKAKKLCEEAKIQIK